MKTVSFIFTYDYSLKTWFESGTLDRELKQFEEIAEKGQYSFKFFTYGNSEDIDLFNNSASIEIYPIYENLKYRSNKFFRFIYSFLIPFKISKIVKGTDLIYQNQLNGSWVSIILKIITKRPLIVRTGYDTYFFSIKENKKIWIVQFYRLLTYLALKFSDLYTVSSASDLKFLNSKFNNTKIKITRNWTNPIETAPFDSRKGNKILCVGRLVDQKNYEFLFNEFKNLKKNIEIDIVGEGPLKNKLQKIATLNKLKVNFLGNINHDQLLKTYQNYKFYILPSTYEGNPKTLLEAMGSGCVVLASNIENNLEIITNKKNGYTFELKDGYLLDLFNNILSKNSNELYTVHKNAMSYIDDIYTLEVIMKEIINDFDSVID
ncbi:glycosyltransferase [Acidimicrobiia bacterium]|nr:glycosyltransferase [Acidimicrobiia bacterium]